MNCFIFHQVPEKQRLFNDSNIESVQHSRLLLLHLVSDGLKTEDDARLVIMNDMVPLLISLLESPTANQQLQVRNDSVISSILRTLLWPLIFVDLIDIGPSSAFSH